MLLSRERADLEVTVMKKYSTFLKLSGQELRFKSAEDSLAMIKETQKDKRIKHLQTLTLNEFNIKLNGVVLKWMDIYAVTYKHLNKQGLVFFGLVWFGLVLWHINHCGLFNAESIFIHLNGSLSDNSV